MKKKIFMLALAVILVVSMLPMTAFAAKGPSSVDIGGSSYISIGSNQDYKAIYSAFPEAEITSVKGATYDKKTNTLTLKNFKQGSKQIVTNEMGDDFKIKIVGTCNVGQILVWGFGYGGSCKITGTGTITINKNKKFDDGVLLMTEDDVTFVNPEGSVSKLVIDKKVNLKAYSTKKGAPLYVVGSKATSKGITINGTISGTNKIKSKKLKNQDGEVLPLKDYYVSGTFLNIKAKK